MSRVIGGTSMKKTDDRARKLVVKKETLRALSADDLQKAAGGYRNNCTNKYSGCGSQPP
jgi:hypothetical protein